jgi:carboxyl-terminal processing protease
MENKKYTLYIPLIVAVSVAAGILLGNLMKQNSSPFTAHAGFSKPNKISTILDLVENGYVDSVNTSELTNKAIPEILKNLDPHTSYIPPREMKEVQEEMRGNFSGIGVQFVVQEDTVRVVEVISGGPSSKVGVLPGDRIVRVNDSIIAGNNVQNNTVLNLLRGEKGTKVEIGILRKDQKGEMEFEIIRDDIPIYSIDVSYMIDNETGFVKISRFADKTYQEFMHSMEKLDKLGANKIIIDLRQNPGGSLSAVLNMVDEFLDKGALMLYTEGANQPKKTYNASGKGTWKNKKLFVLLDEYSASASEIFAGALQDNDNALIIGRRSFGKGLVQEQIPLMDGSALRLTVARFYTPSGRCIQKPYENGTDEYYRDVIETVHSSQLLSADSIRFNEKLKYKTKAGRTVYGGGGIMPDVFVPLDTTGISDYFTQLNSKGLIYRFSYTYTDEHREALSQLKTAAEIESYLDKVGAINAFIKYAAAKGIEKNEAGYNRSKLIINTQLKAYIARNVIGEEGFYPIIRKIDNTLLKAIDVSKQNFIVENIRR